MAWLKIDDNAPHHRKQLAVGDVACWLWVCGLAYCQRHATDGVIPVEALPFLGCGGWKRSVEKLVAAGLWERVGHGYHVHDFLEWNDSRESREQKTHERNARVTRFREHRKRVTVASPVEGVKRDGNAAPTPTPLPTPIPIPIPISPSKNDGEARAARGGGLVMNSLEFEKAQKFNAFVGERLQVPHKIHRDFVKLAGPAHVAELLAWYRALDDELAAHPTDAITPDVWKWLEARFKPWLAARASDAEARKFLEGA